MQGISLKPSKKINAKSKFQSLKKLKITDYSAGCQVIKKTWFKNKNLHSPLIKDMK